MQTTEPDISGNAAGQTFESDGTVTLQTPSGLLPPANGTIGVALDNRGTIDVYSSLTLAHDVTNTGTLAASGPGYVDVQGNLSGNGLALLAGGILELEQSASGRVKF